MNNVDGKLFALALTWFVIGATAMGNKAALAQDPAVEILAATCAGCHGPKGNSEGPATPTISGISQAYFILAMDQYRQGQRNSTIMKRIAKGYSWEQIRALADYFAGQPMVPLNQSYDKVKAGRGKRIHLGTTASGAGLPDLDVASWPASSLPAYTLIRSARRGRSD